MSWMEIKGNEEKRAKLIADAGEILRKAHAENRSMSEEETRSFDAMHADAEKLYSESMKSKRQEEAEKSLEIRGAIQHAEKVEKTEKSNKDFESWIRKGTTGATETRTVSGMGGTGYGAEMVAPTFADRFVEALADFSGIRKANPTVLVTATGADLTVPVVDDTANVGVITGVNTALTDDHTYDVATSSKTLKSYAFNSKVVRVPLQLLQDTQFPVEQWLIGQLVNRLGRAMNAYDTTGAGTTEPEGAVTGSSLGATTASSTALTYAELIDLKHSVDPAYRGTGRCKFMFHDKVLAAAKKLTDSYGQPLWNGGNVAQGIAPTLDGDEYVVNNAMEDDIAASNKIVLYGDFSYQFLRDVRQIEIMRLVERYAEYLQVGFIAWCRHDSVVTNSAAIKHLLCKPAGSS